MRVRELLPLILLVLLLLSISLLSTSAQVSGPAGLAVGGWWKLQTKYHYDVVGQGRYQGSLTWDSEIIETFTVSSQSSTALSLEDSGTTSRQCTVTGYWTSLSECAQSVSSSNFGPWSYTIDLASMQITASSLTGLAGIPVWYLIQPQGLTTGSKVWRDWITPQNGDTKVQYTVTQILAVTTPSGVSIPAITLSYTGPTTNGAVWITNLAAQGTETDNLVYDSSYGIQLADSASGAFSFGDSSGTFSENDGISAQIMDTNIFATPTTTLLSITIQNGQTQTALSQGQLPDPLVLGLGIGLVAGVSIMLIYVLTSRRGGGDHDGPRRCRNCQALIQPDWVVCGECGHLISPLKAD